MLRYELLDTLMQRYCYYIHILWFSLFGKHWCTFFLCFHKFKKLLILVTFWFFFYGMMLVAFKTEVTMKSNKILNSFQFGNNFELIEIWQTVQLGQPPRVQLGQYPNYTQTQLHLPVLQYITIIPWPISNTYTVLRNLMLFCSFRGYAHPYVIL